MSSEPAASDLTLAERLLFWPSYALGYLICEPQLRLGRWRHDNHCDDCGESCGQYAMDKLEFPLEDLAPDASTTREKLRAALDAQYVRLCLECGTAREATEEQSTEAGS